MKKTWVGIVHNNHSLHNDILSFPTRLNQKNWLLEKYNKCFFKSTVISPSFATIYM